MDNFLKPESINTNILHQFLDYRITFLNSRHTKPNSKSYFVLKAGFKRLFKLKDF